MRILKIDVEPPNLILYDWKNPTADPFDPIEVPEHFERSERKTLWDLKGLRTD